MERRSFLRTLLGVAAATALPSEVWPFKKIFLPMAPRIVTPLVVSPALVVSDVEAIELEYFARQIPDLFYRGNVMYDFLKKMPPLGPFMNPELVGSKPQQLVPLKEYLEGDDYDDF
jgi:hypothetical protein